MGFFHRHHTRHGDCSVSSKSTNSTESATRATVQKSSPTKGSPQGGSPKPKKSTNIKAVESFLGNMNHFKTVEDFLIPFTSKNATLKPEDFAPMSIKTFAKVMEGIHKSFPDVHFQYKSIQESPDDPNMILVDGFFCTATHTGAPYSYAPGAPAIPAQGIKVKNDEENFYFSMVNGKIHSVELLAFGTLTGPAGLYEQIGGDPTCINK